MKNIAFWNFLVFALMTVCLFNCDQAQNMTNGIITDPLESEALGTPDAGTETPLVGEKQPQGQPISTPDQDSEVEKLLEEIKRLEEEQKQPQGQPIGTPDQDSEVEKLLEEIKKLQKEIDDSGEGIGIGNIPSVVKVPEPKSRQSIRDNDPPKITDSNIKDGDDGVSRNSVIWIKFNEPIVDGDLRLRIRRGRTVDTRVNYGNETVHLERFGKNLSLEPLTTYVVEGTVSDAANNETEVELTFTTGEEHF